MSGQQPQEGLCQHGKAWYQQCHNCDMERPKCSPTLTECPRCHNDLAKCDGLFRGDSQEALPEIKP